MTAFTLATLNAYWLYDSVAPFERWGVKLPDGGLDRKIELLAQAIMSVGPASSAAPDIVGLQEVENIDIVSRLRDKLIESGSRLQHVFCSETLDPFTGQNVAILSVFPSVIAPTLRLSETVIPFKDSRGFERMGSLGKFLRVDLDVFGKPLTVFVAHLKSQRGGTERTTPLRTAQAQILRDISRPRIEQGNSRSPAFTALIGDLNDEPKSRPIDTILGKYDTSYKLLSATERLPVEDRWTYIHDNQKSQLDHVLLSRFTHDRMINSGITRIDREASDHDAVWAEIDLNL